MGQAWCKDKSTKAQNSKSPLDQVFVSCAHRIYPELKETGSKGATQRVTSSEIGYAGSPPRAALIRGRSIDSVDRPFHPSEWVDVNLEVPCTPRASVILSGQRRHSDLLKFNGERMHADSRSPDVATQAPVPPPRRRRRRDKRPLPPKPGSGGDGDDDESEHEPEPLYSKLTPTIPIQAPKSEDSEDDFAAIELYFQEHLLREQEKIRPKNTTTSLQNIEDLLDASSAVADDAARRPPRQPKTGSLPHNVSLFTPQTPERTFVTSRIEENVAEDPARLRNVIEKIEAECAVGFGDGLKTSTPIKAREQSSVREPSHDSESTKDESSESRVSSSPSAEVLVAGNPSRREEDAGYESRTDSNSFSDASAGRIIHGAEERSSGIVRDTILDSLEESESNNLLVMLGAQRTISEESLPHEMLVDELDEVDEPQMPIDELKSANSTSNEMSVDEDHELDTPPPTPVSNYQKSPLDAIDGHGSREIITETDSDNPTSMTPSLMELEVALTVMLEKKDEQEREREAAEDKSPDKLPEPQIVPVKQECGLEDVEDHRRVAPQPPMGETEGQQPSENRLIDFPRAERTNPFNALISDDLEPPEKPSRLQRISLVEESVIDEPLLVPTPPRRRHRSKSNLNSSSESTEALPTYAVVDRLI